jgi:SacI restriction endonuclease
LFMSKTINYKSATNLLNECLEGVTNGNFKSDEYIVDESVLSASQTLFASKTQSYREVLLGCSLVRYFDKSVDLKLPYINLGQNSYNGRTLDENVVNPFFQANEIPSSKGPYLATFRRSVTIDGSILSSQRDKLGFSALITAITFLSGLDRKKDIKNFICFIIKNFTDLREASKIQIAKIKRLSLNQHKYLIDELIKTKSGGLLPVLITVALLKTISSCYKLDWKVELQGINEADHASGAGGDVTIKTDGEVICVLEVTERPIDSTRVVSTFNSKIVRNGITDYIFVYKNIAPSVDAINSAERYFGQGHEINFVRIAEWVINNLATLGTKCREMFLDELISLIDNKEVSSGLKVRWNGIIRSLSEI